MFRIQTMLRIAAFVIFSCFSFVSIAQDSVSEKDAEGGSPMNHVWYSSPWVWIIGAILFILLMIAFLKRSEKKG